MKITSLKKTHNKCRVCASEGRYPVYCVKEMLFGTGEEFNYFECTSCGCLQIEDIPSDLSPYYPSSYCGWSITADQLFTGLLKRTFKGVRDRHAILHTGLLGRLLCHFSPAMASLEALSQIRISRKTSILDVGAGSGIFLYALYNAGFRDLLGIDPFIGKSIYYDNGLQILKRSIDEIEGKWDVITFNMSFEHIVYPEDTLTAAAMALKEMGVCIIRIPVFPNEAWRRYGVYWVQIDAPRHLFLHSVGSMTHLASRAGLEIRKVVYESDDLQFWGSEQNIRGIPLESPGSYFRNKKSSIFSPAEIKSFRKQARKLNCQKQGDAAAFYLTLPAHPHPSPILKKDPL